MEFTGLSFDGNDAILPSLTQCFSSLVFSHFTHIPIHTQHTHVYTYTITYTHTHTHTHLCTHMPIHTQSPTHTHTYTHTPIHTHLHTHTHTPTHTHTYTHTHLHTHTHTHTHLYTHTYTHTHIHTYTHTPIHTHAYTYRLNWKTLDTSQESTLPSWHRHRPPPSSPPCLTRQPSPLTSHSQCKTWRARERERQWKQRMESSKIAMGNQQTAFFPLFLHQASSILLRGILCTYL